MIQDYYRTLLSAAALARNCGPGHKTAILTHPSGGLTLMHGDHRREVPAHALESEVSVVTAVNDFIEIVHAYDEDEDER